MAIDPKPIRFMDFSNFRPVFLRPIEPTNINTLQALVDGAKVTYNGRPIVFVAERSSEYLIAWQATVPAIQLRGRIIFADAVRTRRYLRKFGRKARLKRQNRCKR